METNNKPDFEKMAKEYGITLVDEDSYIGTPQHICTLYGMEKIWNDYVIVERNQHQIELSNYAYQIDVAKRERDKAESENQALKSELDQAKAWLKEFAGYCTDDPNIDDVQDFLKDKR